ncbi:MAG: hypothetical protein LBV40_05445 [Methanomicrobiales archaeon]|jgi:hypothetical protein|nr:hypothetical protein [Methanomicrobiales archaeon]
MAVNRAQVESVLSSSSIEDPEIQLLMLRDEVELLKTSIKRLLIDIRERMNDAENPLVTALKGQAVDMVGSRHTPPMNTYVDDSDAHLNIESEDNILENKKKVDSVNFIPLAFDEVSSSHAPTSNVSSAIFSLSAERDRLESLRSKIFTSAGNYNGSEEISSTKPNKRPKVKIQEVYSLFEWTSANVRRYGHDRVDLMLESYKEMGHISDEHCKQVKDIARLMAPSIGEVHEMRADEFVLALYELNRILQPNDPTLDRDMVSVLIDKKKGSFENDKMLDDSSSLYEREEGADSDFEYVQSRE